MEEAKVAFMIDSKLGESAADIFKKYFAEPEATADRDQVLTTLIHEKGENKQLAFSLFVGYCSTGLVSGEKLSLAITKTPPAERGKVPIMVASWILNEPKDDDAMLVMEAVKENNPELIADIIKAKVSLRPGAIRKIIMKFLMTEKLHLRMAELDKAENQKSMTAVAN